MVQGIATTKNRTYKYIRSLQQKKYRSEYGRFTVEGIKSVSDALASRYEAELIAVSDSFYNNEPFGYPDGMNVFVVEESLFCGLCDTKTPQGIIAVIKKPQKKHDSLCTDRLYVYCDGVSDPGNLGTIIRTAEAAGFGGVLLSEGCADVYSPKVVRASMGSVFNIDIHTDFSVTMLTAQKDDGFTLYSGALGPDSIPYTEPDYTKPCIIIIGNEANGVSDDILSISEHIIIPIYGKAESLNAAVAGAIMMYEAINSRERKKR